MATEPDNDFYDTLPVFTQFSGVTETSNYKSLPDDWALAIADIVDSTKAIEAGRYKAVNMAGASVISALMNALGKKNYPFVFGGDGALVALPSSATSLARETLAAVQSWVSDDIDLVLRAAIVPMSDIRAEGLDVRVARFEVSSDVSYAMFSGGGSSWAEAQMKAGRYAITPAPPGTRPDLSGLSCRWRPIQARNGEIVSIIAIPGNSGATNEFQMLVNDIIAVAAEQGRGAHPLPRDGPPITMTVKGVDAEARATAPPAKRLSRKIAILGQIGLTFALDRLGLTAGGFDPRRYKIELSQNSDFRKFDDGLKMTIDIDGERLRRIETLLEKASESGIVRYGLHRQDSALITCFVPTPRERDHIHFIDGATGGYAMAASNLKAKLS
ncbi:DUF3095 domain-containing protein [Phyllobacterium endophyticum]|uniref:Adenylate cyclase n=1 Tax=Phyllobacterium endophyticum TaxID=1149773 RepID=A0A2P7ANY8_9HYPH|nr:DUF3095 domain-containing protein [Phyllobacterium endophyticum]MBB3233737.1 hypothetical protein [Phyllobacterium endophyticum]PSH55920.1 adenylate cyclase [Phyllobacterium endophyticum]TYR41063.1 DUF3095 domain-containing protein [Phyllobacterium endophyticum]